MKPLLLASTLALLPLAAQAQTRPDHAIDMTAVLNDEHGRPVKDTLAMLPDGRPCVAPAKPGEAPNLDACPPLTLGHAIAHVLYADLPGDKVTCDQKIADDKAAALTVGEIAVIKRRLGEAYSGVILAQAYPLLDPNAKPPEIK